MCREVVFFLPGTDDRADEYEVDEGVAGVDGVDLKGADFKDVRLGPTGGDEAEPDDGAAQNAATSGLFAGGLNADAENDGDDDRTEDRGCVLNGWVEAVS